MFFMQKRTVQSAFHWLYRFLFRNHALNCIALWAKLVEDEALPIKPTRIHRAEALRKLRALFLCAAGQSSIRQGHSRQSVPALFAAAFSQIAFVSIADKQLMVWYAAVLLLLNGRCCPVPWCSSESVLAVVQRLCRPDEYSWMCSCCPVWKSSGLLRWWWHGPDWALYSRDERNGNIIARFNRFLKRLDAIFALQYGNFE